MLWICSSFELDWGAIGSVAAIIAILLSWRDSRRQAARDEAADREALQARLDRLAVLTISFDRELNTAMGLLNMLKTDLDTAIAAGDSYLAMINIDDAYKRLDISDIDRFSAEFTLFSKRAAVRLTIFRSFTRGILTNPRPPLDDAAAVRANVPITVVQNARSECDLALGAAAKAKAELKPYLDAALKLG
jgi:hypothetical protein